MTFVYLHHTWHLISWVTRCDQYSPALCLLSGVMINSAPFLSQEQNINYMPTVGRPSQQISNYLFPKTSAPISTRAAHLKRPLQEGFSSFICISDCFWPDQSILGESLTRTPFTHSPGFAVKQICSQTAVPWLTSHGVRRSYLDEAVQ